MKRRICCAAVFMFVSIAVWGQSIRSAGELFVNLDVTNVTGLANDTYVTSWATAVWIPMTGRTVLSSQT